MKKNLFKGVLMLLIAAIAQTSCNAAEDGKLHITGQLAGMTDKAIVATMSSQQPDTIATPDGKIDTRLSLSEVEQVYLLPLKDGRPYAQIVITGVPGEECVLSGDVSANYYVTGSAFYKDYDKMDRALEPVAKEQTDFTLECQRMMESGVSQDSVMAYYESRIGDIQARVQRAQWEYLKANTCSEAVATLLGQLPVEKAHEAYDLLDTKVKQGRMKPLLDKTLEQADKELARLENAKKIAQGLPAPDFTLNDINGKPLALSSLRGKYVVLDFWGSWCGWCIKGFPEMKNYYKKYAGKFEILGIDCNDSEQKWKDAVKKYELLWLHVYNPRGGDITTKYAIEGFPTKILVDPEGNIARVIVGEDPAFYTFLDEQFGK